MLERSPDYAYLFHHFIDQVTEYAIFTLDKNGYINSWNAGAGRIKGYTDQEIIGQHLRIFFSDEAVALGKPEEGLLQARDLGYFKTQDWRRKKDGSLFWANVVLTAIYGHQGQLVGFTKITRDLTEEKNAEDELRHKQDELLRVNQDLDNFIQIASHDLRAPINNIDGLVSGLLDILQDKVDPEIRTYIDLLQASVRRFRRTIKELTEITKLNQVVGENHYERIYIPGLYQEIQASLQEGAAGPYFFYTDFQATELSFPLSKLRSILYNLLSNAVKYASPDRPCEIRVGTWREGDYLILAIRDNGLGIRAQDQRQLFTMFRRFHPEVEGTGIGLYTIKRILDAAGGRITCTSEENKGSEFKVFFKNQ
jgi:PAS domain S-box-containing protein